MRRTPIALAVTASVALVASATASGPLYLSLQFNRTVDGVPIDDQDVFSTTFDGATPTVVFSLDTDDIDAAHRTGESTWYVSADRNGLFNGIAFDDGDLVEIDIVAGTLTTIIPESAFTSESPDITSASVLPDGDILFTMLAGTNTLATPSGPLTITPTDIVAYDPATGEASIWLSVPDFSDDGSATGIDGLHALPDGTLLVSLNRDEFVSGVQTLEASVFRYDPVNATVETVYPESNLPSGTDINAVFYEGDLGSAPTNSCMGDFDSDGDVDLGDFGFFGAAFGSVAGDMNYEAVADFDNDGDVDLGDFGAFGAEFGRMDCLD